jgi:hypothetical protein
MVTHYDPQDARTTDRWCNGTEFIEDLIFRYRTACKDARNNGEKESRLDEVEVEYG